MAFRKIKNDLYFRYPDGFYVYAPPSKFKSYVGLIKYVCRYVARPVMAESRIIDYDETFVTFWYQRHEEDLIIIEKLHAFEFISRIIIHIPEPNFKQIRYYGAYHNSTIILIDIVKFLSKEKSNLFKSLTNNWRSLSLLSFSVDPIVCSLCNIPMLYYYSSFT